ncbi:DUF4339 domain-containing protein [Luteolibacter sp. GHJ8]|uniref:DUF4339 domain-containing protein n=1 Tax=Luteolibacter rhizosphaerae TaxID=2989719 RepID=A0ABT3G2X4_9BACT|nr:DUF4339 domain-containing protein [Luteolibacter rhizosphaerae]MCW1914211.1 DUF4339 domain-containing protein [Luteolibacter rhizosphaerae]
MYYVSIEDEVSGPFTVEELGQLIAEHKITPHTMAVMEGYEDWKPLGKLIHIQGEEQPHVTKDVKHGKKCPFCGGKDLKTATRDFYSTGFSRVFAPKVCNYCQAIWTPQIETSTAFLIVAVGLIGIVAAMMVMGPHISHVVGWRDTAPKSIGDVAAANWVIGGVILVVGATAVRKGLRYLMSAKARAFRVLRHPQRI